jgi:hypothetical protein
MQSRGGNGDRGAGDGLAATPAAVMMMCNGSMVLPLRNFLAMGISAIAHHDRRCDCEPECRAIRERNR